MPWRGIAGPCPVWKSTAARVESIATPGIQILVAAGLTFDSEGRPFRITQPSAPLKSAFADLGLRSALERWSVE